MTIEWFFEANQAPKGPIDEAELRRLASDGTITHSTLLWTRGMGSWEQAQTARSDLFPSPPPIPPNRDPAFPPPIPKRQDVAAGRPVEDGATGDHVMRNGVCERCGCSETYIVSMSKTKCSGEGWKPSEPSKASKGSARKEKPWLVQFGAAGLAFGSSQALFFNAERGVIFIGLGLLLIVIGFVAEGATRGKA